MDVPKNKNSLKIIIPKNNSNEEISTSGGSYNTPKTPNMPIKPVIQTEPSKNKKNGINIKDKLINNPLLNKNIQNKNNNNNNNNNNSIKEENIDLYYPMAFTFNSKEKKNKTLNNNRRLNNKYNKSFDKNKNNIFEPKEIKDKEKTIPKKRREILSQKSKDNKFKKESDKNNKNKNLYNNKSFSYDKNKYKIENKNNIRNNFRNYSQKEERKARNNCVPLYDRKLKSAKKNKETINIITMNNNNIIRRNSKDDKKDLYIQKINIKTLKSEYDKKKKEIVNLRVKNKINNILEKLPENYEKSPFLNNKFELFMKNINEMEYALNRINSKKFVSKK